MWQVKEADIAQKVAELTNVAGRSDLLSHAPVSDRELAYITCSTQRPPHESRFDLFLLHGLTSSVHLVAFLDEPTIGPADLRRIVEYVGRFLIAVYASVGCPEPQLTYALQHQPKTKSRTWFDLYNLAAIHKDDGHLAKAVRALGSAQDISLPYDHRQEFSQQSCSLIPRRTTRCCRFPGVWLLLKRRHVLRQSPRS
jgi:hypothetical protein